MQFNVMHDTINELQRRVQEIQSTSYAVVPVCTGYLFISYFDLETLRMGYTITDSNYAAKELLKDIPVPVLIEFGIFVKQIEEWQKDGETEFPFSMHLVDELPGTLDEITPNMPEDFDGEEGELK